MKVYVVIENYETRYQYNIEIFKSRESAEEYIDHVVQDILNKEMYKNLLEKRVYGRNHIVLTIRDESLEYPEEDEYYGDLWGSFIITEKYTKT